MGRKAKGKNAKRTTEKEGRSNGWPDVAIRVVDALYDLAQTGNLVGAIVVGLLLWFLIIAVRIPVDSIGSAFNGFWLFLSNEKYYFVPLLSALVVSVITNILQAKVYRAHIQDLTEHRKFLIHGLEAGKLSRLKNHTTSGFDVVSGDMNRNQGDKDDSG